MRFELYEDNAGGLYIYDNDRNHVYQNLELTGTQFMDDLLAILDGETWQWSLSVADTDHIIFDFDSMEPIAVAEIGKYPADNEITIRPWRAGNAGRRYLGLPEEIE